MTPPDSHLYLHEEVLLLALDDDKGTTGLESAHPYAVGGAVLADLLDHGRIRLHATQTPKVGNPTPTGNPFLDSCLETLAENDRPTELSKWVGRLARRKHLTRDAAERMCSMGILRAEQRRLLGLFKRTVFPEADPTPERELLGRLRWAVTGEQSPVDERTAILLSLAHPTGLLRRAFGKKLIKANADRIRKITEDQAFGAATAAVVKEVEAMAVMIATGAAVTSTVVS